MINTDYILNEIPSLRLSDSGAQALQWMEEFRVSHLPIVKEGKYVGLLSDEEIMDLDSLDESIEEAGYELLDYSVKENEHIYNSFKLASDLSLSMVPVVNNDHGYVGYIDLLNMVNAISELVSFNEPGGIVVLEMNQTDYSVSEIGQIVEGDGAKVLSLYVKLLPNSLKLLVTLKLNKTNINGILQSFERYDYLIKASFQESSFNKDVQDRYDEFMKYLNM